MDGQEGPGLLEYWRILNRRKGTVILIAFVGLALGVLITLPQTPVYQAKAVLEVQNINENFMNMKEATRRPRATTRSPISRRRSRFCRARP
jgi:uncharacterized protein involved in exopolysaccharide biosynthesis